MKIDAETQTSPTIIGTERDGITITVVSSNKEIDRYEYNSNVICLSNPPTYTLYTIYKDGTKDVSYPTCLSHYRNSGNLIDLCNKPIYRCY